MLICALKQTEKNTIILGQNINRIADGCSRLSSATITGHHLNSYTSHVRSFCSVLHYVCHPLYLWSFFSHSTETLRRPYSFTMDTTILFLTDQLNELELDKLRLGDGDDGAEASGLSSADADNNDVADCQQLAGGDQQTGRSDTGSVRFEKLRKDTVNQSCIGGSEVVNHQLGLRNQVSQYMHLFLI